MIIYKTTNLLNWKFYIGKDKYNDPKYLGSGKILKAAIKKYGPRNFKKETLESCSSEEELNSREKFWISQFNATNNNYNIATGGNGGDTISNHPNKYEIGQRHSNWMNENTPFTGTKMTEEQILKLKNTIKKKYESGYVNPMKNKKLTDETKQKMREKAIGRKVSSETGKKISNANLGRISPLKGTENKKHSEWMKKNNPFRGKSHSDETKKLLSKLNSSPKSEEHKRKLSENSPNNKVCLIDNVKYRSVAEASRSLNISEGTIRDRLKNKKFQNYRYEQ